MNKAAGVGEPVTQEIAISVRGDKVECSINNKVVASYDRPALVTAGKLKSTDGVYGIRFAHNTEGFVTGLTITKPLALRNALRTRAISMWNLVAKWGTWH